MDFFSFLIFSSSSFSISNNDAVFRRLQTSKSDPQLIFSNDELHIILKRRNLNYSSIRRFFKLLTKLSFKSSLEFRNFESSPKIEFRTLTQNRKLADFYRFLYRSLDPSKKRRQYFQDF